MVDQTFCDLLEYEICRALRDSDFDETSGFWCDGVLMSKPDTYYSLKYLNENRKTELKAFIGKHGQTEYRLLLKLSENALIKFANNLSIKERISFTDFKIDIKDRQIEIQLD